MNEQNQTHTYSRGAEIFRTAAESFGIEVGEDQFLEWRHLLDAAFVLDTILDSSQPIVAREASYDCHVSFIVTGDTLVDPVDSLKKLRSKVTSWDEQRVERLSGAAENIKTIARQRRQAITSGELTELAVDEGLETAKLFTFEPDSAPGVDTFNQFLQNIMPLGVLIDTAADLPEDYANGLTKVPPSLRNRIRVLSSSTTYVLSTLRRTPLALYGPLLRATAAVRDDSEKDKVQVFSRA